MIEIKCIVDEMPAGFAALRAEAHAEGHRFLERLAADWAAQTIRFDGTGEALLLALIEAETAGIGGITIDPFIAGALRMRRFYVRPRFRRRGVGRRLAAALLERPTVVDWPITVNAPAAAFAFWQALGFRPDPRDGHTHIRQSGST